MTTPAKHLSRAISTCVLIHRKRKAEVRRSCLAPSGAARPNEERKVRQRNAGVRLKDADCEDPSGCQNTQGSFQTPQKIGGRFDGLWKRNFSFKQMHSHRSPWQPGVVLIACRCDSHPQRSWLWENLLHNRSSGPIRR